MSDDDSPSEEALLESEHMYLLFKETFQQLAAAAAPVALDTFKLTGWIFYAAAPLLYKMLDAKAAGDIDEALTIGAAILLIHQEAVRVDALHVVADVDSEGKACLSWDVEP